RPDELPPEAGPLHRVGRGRARGPRAAAPSHRPDRPAPGPVRPDVLPAARDPGRMARRHAVRACRCECARQVRAALGAAAGTNLLLAQDFPPMGGGIARLHGEMAKRYPACQLVVSTPQDPDAADFDAQRDGIVDRLPVGRRRTKSLPGLLLWSRRAATLARRHKVRFVHCGNVKPAGYPARWVLERCRVPYGIYFHGGDLLSEQHKIRHSRLQRRSTRAILGGAAVLMVNSAWTRDLALGVLGELGLDGHSPRLRVVHLGTDPGRFMPGVDPTELRERLGLPEDGVRWMLTVARPAPHKGAGTALRALPAILRDAGGRRPGAWAAGGGGTLRGDARRGARRRDGLPRSAGGSRGTASGPRAPPGESRPGDARRSRRPPRCRDLVHLAARGAASAR